MTQLEWMAHERRMTPRTGSQEPNPPRPPRNLLPALPARQPNCRRRRPGRVKNPDVPRETRPRAVRGWHVVRPPTCRAGVRTHEVRRVGKHAEVRTATGATWRPAVAWRKFGPPRMGPSVARTTPRPVGRIRPAAHGSEVSLPSPAPNGNNSALRAWIRATYAAAKRTLSRTGLCARFRATAPRRGPAHGNLFHVEHCREGVAGGGCRGRWTTSRQRTSRWAPHKGLRADYRPPPSLALDAPCASSPATKRPASALARSPQPTGNGQTAPLVTGTCGRRSPRRPPPKPTTAVSPRTLATGEAP